MKAGYGANTEGAVALSAGVARTILGVLAPASFGVDLIGFRVAFDGVTAANVPVLVELGACTFATKPPGTNSTAVTVDQTYGRSIVAGFTAASSWAAANEPTTITPIDEWLLTPNGGLVMYDFPRDRTPDNAVATGFVIRCNAPANVNVRGTLFFERV
jgi:hypothetical protein